MTQTRRVLAGAALLVAVTAIAGAVAMASAQQATPAPHAPVNTAAVEMGRLAAAVSLDGTLTYRGRSDGSPYAVINHAQGTYTRLPDAGDEVGCGDVLYRVDDHAVLLLCGIIPAYRDLHQGDAGDDVRQLNQNLGVGPDDHFSARTGAALDGLQRDKGLAVTGVLGLADAVFLPGSVRIAKVTGALGGPAQPGAPVLDATTDTLEVQVDLAPSQQGQVQPGDRAHITLPGNRSVTGKVDRLGRVAQIPPGQNNGPGDVSIPAFITLDDPGTARAFDRAPVQVEITTEGVESALSVPVTAVVGKAGGGFAVEAVRGGRRELVAVELGLFDSTGGRVEVEGDLREGDRVVVPSL